MWRLSAGVLCITILYMLTKRSQNSVSTIGTLTISTDLHQIIIKGRGDIQPVLELTYPELGLANHCSVHAAGAESLCLDFTHGVRLEIGHEETDGASCYNLAWTPAGRQPGPETCLVLQGQWYGGSEMFYQHWPVQLQRAHMQAYVSSDILNKQYKDNTYGSVIERFWVSSQGFGLKVDDTDPLLVSLNDPKDGTLCLRADGAHWRYQSDTSRLRYSLCVGHNVRQVHQAMLRKHFDKPSSVPDLRMFKSPIWSTWARFKIGVNQTNVLQYANEVIKQGFPNSQLEIDDMYTSFYGETDFATEKFPDAQGMIAELHKNGFRVTSWVHPFINVEAPSFRTAMEMGYFVRDPIQTVPALVRWWQGVAGLIDMTNPKAVQWYVNRLENLRRTTGVDSFKFDAGEVMYFPMCGRTLRPLVGPGEFTSAYAEVVSKFGGMVELRVGTKSQKHGVFVRMMDKDSEWGYNNGLRTMIPTALIMGVLGYPFILPDMIGGNAYSNESMLTATTVLPEKELFIRWMQLSAFLPSMQFSVAPWQYDQQTVNIARRAVQLHQEVAFPAIVKAAEEAVANGWPIIRPLWWIAPTDQVALSTDSQFLIGQELMVAPVLDKGSRSRDIYFPEGSWKDPSRKSSDGVYVGPRWVQNYKAALEDIPYFIRTT